MQLYNNYKREFFQEIGKAITGLRTAQKNRRLIWSRCQIINPAQMSGVCFEKLFFQNDHTGEFFAFHPFEESAASG